jgi:DNA-binding MarR family transcriptional regulator
MTAKNSPLYNTRFCKCWALRRASRLVTQHYEASFRGTGLRATQFTLLAVLTQAGPLPLTELAELVGLERTSLTRNLRLLEKKGYVSDLTDADQRVRRITVTKKGEAAALAALDAWNEAQDSVGDMLHRTGIDKSLTLRRG